MRNYRHLIAICVCSLSLYSALADVGGNELPLSNQEVISKSLDGFIGQARDAGLLSGPDSLSRQEIVNADAERLKGCREPYPLNFKDHKNLRQYKDIYEYQKDADDALDGQAYDNLVKAYLGLGLYSEVAAMRSDINALPVSAYIALAHLMDTYLTGDPEFFEELSTCYVEAEFWLGVSRLSDKNLSGAILIERHIEAFRELPLQLRIDVAVLMLPVLRHNDETLIARKLLAAFSPEERSNAKRLRIQEAFFQSREVDAEGAEAAYDFLLKRSPGMNTLIESSDRDVLLGSAQKEIVLEEARQIISRSKDFGDIAASLKFILADLSASSNYADFLYLLDRPVLADPVFQGEIKEYLVKKMLKDLRGEEKLSKFSVIDILINEPGIISGHQSEDGIFSLAINFLESQNNSSLRAALMRALGKTASLDEIYARLAYRKNSLDEVYNLAKNNSNDEHVLHLALLSSIQSRDEVMFGQLKNNFPKKADLIIELIEEDAIAGGWFISEKIYESLKLSGSINQKERLEKVISLRALSKLPVGPKVSAANRPLASRLSEANLSLQEIAREQIQ